MREILFRGKEIESKGWVYGWFEMYAFGRWPLKASIIPSNEAENGYYEHVEVDMETIGQYTGLTDKNGMKIFEGDLVRSVSLVYNGICVACFSDGCFVLRDESNFEKTIESYCSRQLEVIGNIHDNPELLKKS